MKRGRSGIAQQGHESLMTPKKKSLSNSKSVKKWDILSDVALRRSCICARTTHKDQGRDWRTGRELGKHFLSPAASPPLDLLIYICSICSSAPRQLEI